MSILVGFGKHSDTPNKHRKDQAMNHLYSLALSVLLLVGSVSVATAQDLDKGLEAYNAGDFQTALREWHPLANEGVAPAQLMLGLMYMNGQGVPQGYAEAVKWYRLAAEQGVAPAQGGLGLMYMNGQGVPQDDAEAVKWYRLAAEQGDAPAQGGLGMIYQFSEGVLQSNIMAHMWYNIASANGNSLTGEWRDELAGLMSNADISKAQEMAGECMSSNYQNCGE